ncbi:MAG: DUF4214 domain-containing protein [Pseudomonadota bacterium]
MGGGIADEDGLGTFALQWLRDGAEIDGATEETLALGQADVGAAITLRVSYTDQRGAEESVVSAATAPVANTDNAPEGRPSIDGTAAEDETLTARTASISDADGLRGFSYVWLRDGDAISGARGSSYALSQEDVGARIGLEVSYTDGGGEREQLSATEIGPVSNINDLPTGSVRVEGRAVEGETVTAVLVGLEDEDGLGTLGYQWLRDGEEIDGATADVHVLAAEDVGAEIAVRVFYADAFGTEESLTSAPTGPVANENDPPTGTPVVLGEALEGESLTLDLSRIGDADGLGNVSVQWLADGEPIDGAIATILVLGSGLVGAEISARVTWIDGGGVRESLTSTSTTPVADVNAAPSARDDALSLEIASAGNLAGRLLANDTDPDAGDTLSIASVSPSGTAGQVSFDFARQSITYTPPSGAETATEARTDSFTYTVRDGGGLADTATVRIAIPAAGDGDLFIGQDSTTVDDGVDIGLSPAPTFEPATIDGAPATRANTVDRDTGETVEVIAIEAVTDGNRIDENNRTAGVDVTISDRLGLSLPEGLGLVVARRDGTARENAETVFGRSFDVGEPGLEADDLARFLDVGFGGADATREIVEIVLRPSDSPPDGPITVRVPAASEGGEPPIVAIDATRFKDADNLLDFVIDGGATVLVRGCGRFVGGENDDGPDRDVVIGDACDQLFFFGPGDDVIMGGGGDDVVRSSAGQDRLFGGAGEDTLEGGLGDDTLDGGPGDDSLDGGAGTDTVLYAVTRSDLVERVLEGGRIQVTAPDGTDTLGGVERVELSDGTYLYDLDEDVAFVYRLYSGMLGRAPDEGGLRFWDQAYGSGASASQIASAFVMSKELVLSLGEEKPDPADFIDLLYANSLGRAADRPGRDFWAAQIEDGLGQADLLIAFANSDESQELYSGNYDDGVWVA